MPTTPLLHQLRALGRLLRLVAVGRGLLLWALIASGLLAALAVVARCQGSPYAAPVLVGLAGVGLLGCLTPPLVRRLSPLTVAATVEQRHSHLHELLLTAADLAVRGNYHHSPQLAQAVIRQAEQTLPALPLEPMLQLRRLRPLLLASGMSLLVALGLTWTWRAEVAALLAPAEVISAPVAPAQTPSQPLAPLLSGVQVALQPPAYSGLPARVLTEDFSVLRCLPGTRVSFSLLANASATPRLRVNAQDRPLAAAGQRLGYAFVLRAPTIWSLAVSNATGGDRRDGRVLLLPDHPPQVRLTAPRRDVALREPQPVALAATVQDDFGLSRVALQWRVGETGSWQEEELGAEGRAVRLAYDWDLAPLNLRPGQSVYCRFVARDNNTVTGPGQGQSRTLRITLGQPLPHEAAARLQETTREQGDALDRLRAEAQEIADDLQQMQEQVQSGELRTADPATRAQLQQAADRLQRQAEKLRQAVAEAEQQLQEQNQLSPEARDRLQELTQMLRQTLQQQLPHAIAKLREAAQNLSPQELPRQLEQAQMAQEELLQQLEQLAALLKQAQLEASLANLRDEVQKLLQRQSDIATQTRRTPPNQRDALTQQSRQQEDLAGDTQSLPEKLQQAAQQSAEAAPDLQQRLADMATKTRQQDPAGDMRQAASDLDRGRPDQAQMSQSEAMQSLQELAAQLAGAQADVYRQQRQELQQAARQMLRDALSLSQQQERLQQDTAPLQGRGQSAVVQAKPLLERLGQRQQSITGGLERLRQRMQRLSEKTPLMDPRLGAQTGQLQQQSAQAERDIAGGVPEQAMLGQGEVMAGLNRLAQQLLGSQQSFQQASAQKAWQEYLQRLAQLAMQQQALNQQTQQQGQSGPPSPGQGGPGMAGLADRQQALRDALQKMLGETGESSSFGDQLGGVPAQMDEVEQEMRGARVTKETYRTQAQILHKLLDAQRSLYRKDQQDRQRRAEAPRPYKRPSSPPELRQPTRRSPTATTTSPPARDLPLGYEDLTRQYFEALGRPGR